MNKKIFFTLICFGSSYYHHSTAYTKLSESLVNELIKKYAPEVRFHKKEQHFPSSVPWFTQRCELRIRDKNKQSSLVLTRPINDPTVLKNYPPKDYPNGFNIVNDYYLAPLQDDKTRAGEPLINNECKTSCYVHVQDKDNGGIIIQYIFFYPYQGYTFGATVLGKTFLDIGSHEGDWEHIDVHLRSAPQANIYVLDQVHYAAHGNKPHGKLLFAKDVPLVESTHPIVWAAWSGHASHEKNVGFDKDTLDHTTNDGVRWKCWQCPLINVGDLTAPKSGQEWILFGGRWGSTREEKDKKVTTHVTNSPPGPGIDSPWWRYAEKQYDKIKEIKVNPKSNKASDHFDLKGRVPTRVRTLRWEIISPRASDIAFSVHEYRRLQKDRKNVYGPLSNNSITSISSYNKGLYIADVKTKDGKQLSEPFTLIIWAVEE